MANKNHTQRWEAAILAAALAIAGTLFLFDTMGGVLLSHLLSWTALLHSSPAALAAVAAALVWAEQETPRATAEDRAFTQARKGQL